MQSAPRRLGKASKSVRIPAAIAELDLVMSVLNMMTTPAMIVSNNFYILRETWYPMAAPSFAGVRFLVSPMHFPKMRCA